MKNVIKLGAFLLLAILVASCGTDGAAAGSADMAQENVIEMLYDFEDGVIPAEWEVLDCDLAIIDHNGSKALQLDFHKVQNPKVIIYFDPSIDMNGKTFAFDVSNPGSRAGETWIQTRSAGGDGMKFSSSYDCDVAAGATMTWYIALEWLKFDQDLKDQGHGVQYSQWGDGPIIDAVADFSFWLWEPVRASTVIIDNIRIVDFVVPE